MNDLLLRAVWKSAALAFSSALVSLSSVVPLYERARPILQTPPESIRRGSTRASSSARLRSIA